MTERTGRSSQVALGLALGLVLLSIIGILGITYYATSETLEEISKIEQEQVEMQERSAIAAAERQDIMRDLECYAKNSTEFYIIVSDLLIFNLSVDLTSPNVTDEQRQQAQDALDRLVQFKEQAAAETLECQG